MFRRQVYLSVFRWNVLRIVLVTQKWTLVFIPDPNAMNEGICGSVVANSMWPWSQHSKRYSLSPVMKHIPFTLHDIPSAVLLDKGYSEPVQWHSDWQALQFSRHSPGKRILCCLSPVASVIRGIPVSWLGCPGNVAIYRTNWNCYLTNLLINLISCCLSNWTNEILIKDIFGHSTL
jgi:hypothetical protein